MGLRTVRSNFRCANIAKAIPNRGAEDTITGNSYKVPIFPFTYNGNDSTMVRDKGVAWDLN